MGLWRIERTVEDRLLARRGSFAGEARFTAGEGGLIYDETGTLVFPGDVPMRAQRRYLWREDGGGIAVYFADGRPFHRIDADSDDPTDRHDCPPDLYVAAYDFTDWPHWSSRWTVTGPRKDHDIVSRFTRAEDAKR